MFSVYRYFRSSSLSSYSIIKNTREALFLLFLLFFYGCTEEFPSTTAQLSLEPRSLYMMTGDISFGYSSDLVKSIEVTGDNTPWELVGLPNWITASMTKGNGGATITLTAKENVSVDEARAAIITFTSSASDYQYTKTIAVSQPAADIHITPDETSLSYKAAGETKTISITSNVDWTANCDATWLTLSKVSNTQLRIIVAENLKNSTNRATITLSRTGTSAAVSTISVTQAEAGVTGSTANIAFDVDGETHKTEIATDASWTAYTSDPSWISVSPEGGKAGTASLTITALANNSSNSRKGFVYVRIGTTTKLSIPVSQEGISYSVTPSSLTIPSTPQETTFTMESNTAWSVISKPDWLDIKPTAGKKGVTTITLIAKENVNVDSRNSYVVIGREGFSANASVHVTQEGKIFDSLNKTMEFPTSASTQSLTINTDGAWTASTPDEWIHLSSTSGQGKGTLQISVDENPDKEDRRGKVSVTVGQTTQTATIVQKGRYITILYKGVISKSTPTTVKLTISSILAWTASSDAEWLSVSPDSGDGNATITISVADNPSISQRTATVTLKTSEETKELRFAQPGRTLSLSTNTIVFGGEGGKSNTITIQTDGTFNITSSETWLTIQQSGNTFRVIAAANTGTASRSAKITVALTGLVSGQSLERNIDVTQYASDPLGLCPNNQHPHMINMGTAGRWACCNVGANSPIDYGNYYAWGETTTKTTYNWTTYKWCKGAVATLTKYCTQSSKGTVDNKTQLELNDDAAYINWGGSWRMPTSSDVSDLISKCTWTWVTISGVKGYKVTASNGNCIFLPAAGHKRTSNLISEYIGSRGFYWSSSLRDGWSIYACSLKFKSDSYKIDSENRMAGLSIRPVAN